MSATYQVGDTVFMGVQTIVSSEERPHDMKVIHVHVSRPSGHVEYTLACPQTGAIETRVSVDRIHATERDAWAAEEKDVEKRLASLREWLQNAATWKARIRAALRAIDEAGKVES